MKIMYDLRPLDLRQGLDRLEFDKVLSIITRKIGPITSRKLLPVVVDSYRIFPHIRNPGLLELDLKSVGTSKFLVE